MHFRLFVGFVWLVWFVFFFSPFQTMLQFPEVGKHHWQCTILSGVRHYGRTQSYLNFAFRYFDSLKVASHCSVLVCNRLKHLFMCLLGIFHELCVHIIFFLFFLSYLQELPGYQKYQLLFCYKILQILSPAYKLSQFFVNCVIFHQEKFHTLPILFYVVLGFPSHSESLSHSKVI